MFFLPVSCHHIEACLMVGMTGRASGTEGMLRNLLRDLRWMRLLGALGSVLILQIPYRVIFGRISLYLSCQQDSPESICYSPQRDDRVYTWGSIVLHYNHDQLRNPSELSPRHGHSYPC